MPQLRPRLKISSIFRVVTSTPVPATQRRGFALPTASACPLARFLPARPPSSAFTNRACRGFASSTTRATTASSSPSSPTATSKPAKKDMSTSTESPKCEWLVILPDKPGVLEKRVQVRESHLAALSNAYPADFWLVGGALLGRAPHDPRNEPGKPLPMQGSAALVWAESEDEVRRTLASDVYAREGVWDLEKLQIWAFKSAVRKGL